MVIRTNFFVGGNWKKKKRRRSQLLRTHEKARAFNRHASEPRKTNEIGTRRMKRLRKAHTRQSHQSHQSHQSKSVTISTKPANLYFNIQHQIETKQEKEKNKKPNFISRCKNSGRITSISNRTKRTRDGMNETILLGFDDAEGTRQKDFLNESIHHFSSRHKRNYFVAVFFGF